MKRTMVVLSIISLSCAIAFLLIALGLKELISDVDVLKACFIMGGI